MENCPRSCPSRVLSDSELRNADTSSDCLPPNILSEIKQWNGFINKPLVMREFDVASYDVASSRFQEYQKCVFEFCYQLEQGKNYVP